MSKRHLHRDASTGRIVTEAYAAENPATTVRETVAAPQGARLAPPAPGGDAVPPAMHESAAPGIWKAHSLAYAAGFNACRSLWLAAAPAPAVGREVVAWMLLRSDAEGDWQSVHSDHGACSPAEATVRAMAEKLGGRVVPLYTTPPAEAHEPVGDATLWALHIEGPDDVHPAPSREMAQEAADLFNSTFPQSDNPNWPRAVAKVIEWPHGARAHALESPNFAEYWLLSKTTREARRPCGLTLMLACPLPDGHSGRCEYLPHHVRRIADEMEAWSEKKMIGPNSSRIDRTVVREWARQLRGEE